MINLENLTIVKDFGKNDVYESLIAVNNADNVRYFVKKTTKSILEDDIKRKYYDNELLVNEELDHSNIIKFITKKEILNDIYLLFECTNGGSLANYMKKYMDKFNKPFPEEIVQNIMKQICPGLKYIHDHHIIHRCFDLDNIYIEFPNLEDKANFNLSNAIFKINLNIPDISDPFNKNPYLANGIDTCDFLVSFNKGESLKLLHKVASGGEASRIMLAFKSFFASKTDVSLMIFDEIDTGVSGITAKKISDKMYEISKKLQVICITHLPQVAAKGDYHKFIYKEEINDRTYTKVIDLDYDKRVEEIATMLSGDKLSLYAIEHAKELLNN
jgi:serine/threonine protein kinase